MLVIGVDYSGAKTDNNTWISQGKFVKNDLIIETCETITRENLTSTLGKFDSPTIASLDFPFSVPEQFSNFWCPGAKDMTDLWRAASKITITDFLCFRDAFVKQHGETKRFGDTFYPECYSCLHKANPNLVPMTFYGMQMLDQLNRTGCSIPPLTGDPITQSVLLEAMPGAGLRAMGLPFKGYKNGRHAHEKREIILTGLAKSSGLRISNLDLFFYLGMRNHDALDSIVALVIASLWAKDPTGFRCPPQDPPMDLQLTINLEGWLYAPVFLSTLEQFHE